jgi:hypothetical protein
MAWARSGDLHFAHHEAAGEDAARVWVRARVTVSADALMAALYACFPNPPGTLTDLVASALAAEQLVFTGLNGLYQRAAQITADEQAGTVANPEWLAICRQYVNRMLTGRQDTS